MKNILIIEDEELLIKALEDKFVNEGFNVSIARDGKEGLEKALSSHPDIILLDIIMPVMDGLTMLKELKKDPWGKEVPVIILSNLSSATKMNEAQELNVSAFLVKTNWSLDELIKEVNDILGL